VIPRLAEEFIRLSSNDGARPSSFSMFGREWDLLPDVFPPVHDISTMLFTTWLPFSAGDDLLEVGCGAGVTAAMAALRGCRRVTAVDISPAAVENTRRNVHRHGLRGLVRVFESDLCSALSPDDRYDVIYWNSSFVEAPAEMEALTPVERAVLDPGYRTHARFLAEAPRHLKPAGRIFLGFSSLGNRVRLEELAAAHRLDVRVLRTSGDALSAEATYQLIELVPSVPGREPVAEGPGGTHPYDERNRQE
jgi:release factor glutamine methyltransferase